MSKKLSDHFYSAGAGGMWGVSIYCVTVAFNRASMAAEKTISNAIYSAIVGTEFHIPYASDFTDTVILGAMAIGAGMVAIDAVQKPMVQKKRPVAMIAGAMATLAGIALAFNATGSEPTPTKSTVHDASTIELYQNSSNIKLSVY